MAGLKIANTEVGVAFDVKVVPNSRADAIVGLLGDALKVKVAAPPEAGRANRAVCDLLAATLGVPRAAVTVVAGPTSPRKRIVVAGLDAAALQTKLDAFT
ncbi:MAG: DUF167 domain-containing protein [Phycisphaeraceae bacterium]